MTSKTTLNKLRRYQAMIEAQQTDESWWVNPHEHPLPTLPDQSYLEGDYIEQVEKSCPHQTEIARSLIAFVGKERRG